MNRKTLVTIIIIILLLLAGAAVVYWFWQSRSAPPVTDGLDQLTDTARPPGLVIDELVDVEPSPERPSQDSSLTGAVYYFVERWGSYSNHSNFQNVRELEGFISPAMYERALANYQPVLFDQMADIEYEGYETKVLGLEWQETGPDNATVLVQTQRRRVTVEATEAYPQDILVRLQKQADRWIVIEAVWQAREQF